MTRLALDRRSFFKATASAGVLLLAIPRYPRLAAAGAEASAGGAWSVYVAIHPDNSVTMVSPVMEMGQFMRTTGAMILADEMDLDWSRVTFSREMPVLMKRDEAGEVAYDHAQIGTGGSQTAKNNWDYLRRAGATARRMLLEEAAERWSVAPEALSTAKGFVVDAGNGRRASYGELAAKAALRPVDPERVALKKRASYRIIGKDTGVIDVRDMVTGKPLYGIDEDYPGALQAVIDRAPAFGAEIAGYDRAAALAVPGVQQVMEMARQSGEHWPEGRAEIVGAGVAVVADSLWSAMRGREALKTEWQNASRYAEEDSDEQLREFHQLVAGDGPAEILRDDGDVERAFADADLVLDATYEKPLFIHACMEPLNCLVDIRENDATVVVGHQFPHRAAVEVERVTGIDALKVEVRAKRMGGGFGRRAEVDYLREAVALGAKLRRPVKVTWSRESDTQRDWFDPASVTRIRAALEDGRITAWHHRQAQTKGEPEHACFPAEVVPNYRVERFPPASGIPAGPWRAPTQLQWAFVAESMIDELAYAAKADPLEFRLRLMSPHRVYRIEHWAADFIDSGRMAACYKRAAEMAGWGRRLPAGIGLGIAGHFTFGTYAAFVVEVGVSEREELTIRKAWGAIDCGFAINPNHVRAQMEGGCIDGLNAALFNKAVVRNGQVRNANFDRLRWMRLREAPLDVEVSIIESGQGLTGVGEPPVAPAGAALANAIYAACGKRIRRLPIAESIRI